jgi:glycosyltransferase involved in cell wall biosynthesis
MYGKAFSSQARMLRFLEANANVDLRTDRIPDEEIPDIFGASHVFLAPYQSLFTSGSVMLALTFGLPIIGPNIRELRETTPEDCHHLLYDPASPRGLIRSMLDFVAMSDSDLRTARKACSAFAKDRSPTKIGAEMANLLENA